MRKTGPSDVELLKSIPYFAALKPSELETIRERLMEHTFERGETIFLEGDESEGLYLVRSGLVRIFKTSVEGREQVLLMARPGDSFNDVPVFDGGPNPASAEALEPTRVWLLPKADLLSIVRRYPAVAEGVINVFAQRLRHLTALVEDLSFRRVSSRLAKILLEHARAQVGNESLPRRLTQQQMASLAGTAREMVGRALKAMEREGIIRLDRHRIIILKPQALEEMV